MVCKSGSGSIGERGTFDRVGGEGELEVDVPEFSESSPLIGIKMVPSYVLF